MAALSEIANNGNPLSKLCENTLSEIATPPGRIYEKHHLTVTPAGELAETAAKMTATDEKPKT